MILPGLALVVALVALAAPSPADKPLPDLPDYVFAVSPDEENLDILYFGETRPTLIRFRVRINGPGYLTSWDNFLARLYKFADGNDDGILTEAEANRSGWVQVLANPNGGIFDRSAPPQVVGDGRTVLEAKDGKVSFDHFARYVRDGLGYGPVQGQSTRSADPVDQLTFNHIDTNRDGALSTAELASAEGLIRRLDTDEDEVLELAELNPDRNPFEGFFFDPGESTPGGDPLAGPIVSLATAEAKARAARRLVARYDGIDGSARDERLTLAESGFDPRAFRLADTSGDGRLDLAELERFLADPGPSLVLDLRIGKAPGQRPTFELSEADRSDARVKKKQDQSLTIDMDGREVQLSTSDNIQDFRQFFDMTFQTADIDKDGSLDRSESDRTRIFPRIFDAADRNVDGKLSRAELTLYNDRTSDAIRSRPSLSINDSGRAFFEHLDADGDGRLGRRELREAAKHLKPLDRDGDGLVRLVEIPNHFRIWLGRGTPNSNQRNFNFDTYDSPTPARPGAKGPVVAWFLKMDRNRDGDVSPSEFIGGAELFRKLDADGDGLIDAKEAAKGP